MSLGGRQHLGPAIGESRTSDARSDELVGPGIPGFRHPGQGPPLLHHHHHQRKPLPSFIIVMVINNLFKVEVLYPIILLVIILQEVMEELIFNTITLVQQ